MTLVTFVSLVAFVFATVAAQPEAGGGADGVLSEARCQATVRNHVLEWDGDLAAARPDPVGPTGLRSWRVPTGAMGLWLRIAEVARGEIALERLTATRTERLRFDEACGATEYVVATPVPRPGAFTDSELIMQVSRGPRGVFLLWSPHVPLSVDQHAVLAQVASEMNLVVVPLLDPAADDADAARIARERGLAPGATRALGGIELAFRGMTTRMPSVQAFADGRLMGPVLYGYRSVEALRATLEEVFAVR